MNVKCTATNEALANSGFDKHKVYNVSAKLSFTSITFITLITVVAVILVLVILMIAAYCSRQISRRRGYTVAPKNFGWCNDGDADKKVEPFEN